MNKKIRGNRKMESIEWKKQKHCMLKGVVGMCHCDNLKSASVMQKSGMSKQGVFREEYLCQGKWVDQFYFSILEREYNKRI